MMKFFVQILRFPLTVFVHSIEAVVNAVREIQMTTDQTIDAMVGAVADTLGKAPSDGNISEDPQMTGGVINDGGEQTTQKEKRKMADLDLSGDDLKYVSYSIVFTKPDLETTLEEKRATADLFNRRRELWGYKDRSLHGKGSKATGSSPFSVARQ